jgi:hypothetical protein
MYMCTHIKKNKTRRDMARQVVASWTMYDRIGSSGSPRTIVVYADNTATITMHNVTWYTINGSPDAPISIDPDGGPCFGVGSWLHHTGTNKSWKISRVNYYTDTRVVSQEDMDDMDDFEPYIVIMSVIVEDSSMD